ncbi:hypothetical protein A2Y85_07820 [candidate division WOR-3 bacterium RBG_13_43_14]|uniref:Ig-like domain-containing protein n=1 Tax=candidate division WOR-3 bacterium RBG_13_43_14 TaxID=1802590 RepID=A0A1F4UF50_UNCW3|nr:MAG: hypothetical protein A2Y85_07820 [candidate division WOR-3 bacterium RBG_13_43_14]
MHQFKITSIIMCIIAILLSCTGPTAFIDCDNQTEFNASLYLDGISTDESIVIASPPFYKSGSLLKTEESFNWKLRLFTNTGTETFADSGNIDIKYGQNICMVHYSDPESISVVWKREE